MKILFVAVFKSGSTNISQSRGFQIGGHGVYEYDYRDRLQKLGSVSHRDLDLINAVSQLKPDVVVFSKCSNMSYQVVEECNKHSKTVMWYMDALHNFDQELIDKISRCSSFVCGVEGVIPEGEKINPNTSFVHQCYDEQDNFPTNINQDIDISFIGSLDTSRIHGDRVAYANFLKDHFSGFKAISGVYGKEHNTIVNRTKINLNFSPTDATGVSVRIYKIMASGGFLLTTPWRDMEKTFTPGKHLVTFNDQQELKEKIDYYLSHPEERDIIRKAALEEVQKYHPKEWAKNLLKTII